MFGEPSPVFDREDARMLGCVLRICFSDSLVGGAVVASVKLQGLSRRLRKIREATLAGIRDTWLHCRLLKQVITAEIWMQLTQPSFTA